MTAVVATPVTELRVTCEPTQTHPRLLVVTRCDSYTHASLMTRVRKTTKSIAWLATHNPKRVSLHGAQGDWWLHIGEGAISVSDKEAAKLRDELQIAVRGAT